jgi:hypothetical protein
VEKPPTRPGGPIPAAHPRSARVNAPRETAHEADTAQPGKTRTDPGTKAKRPLDFRGITRLPTPLFPQSQLSTRVPQQTLLHNGEVPRRLPVRWRGKPRHRRPHRSTRRSKSSKGKADTHLRDSAHEQGAVGRSGMHRNGSTTATLTCTGGGGVPMSCGFTGGGRHHGEHQRLTTHLPEGVVLPWTSQAGLAACARRA